MQNRRAFCRTAALTAGAALGSDLLFEPSASAASAATRAPARVTSEKHVGGRAVDLTVASPAMRRSLKVRLLLPRGWSRTARRTWPVLWVFHGGNCHYDAWTRHTDIARLADRSDVIVVMPEGGYAGGYTDWWNYGLGGSYAWETFHLTELRGLLESRYRAGKKRAVVGQSTGGYGALIYSARHPGMFRFAGAFSPFGSTLTPGAPEVLMTGLTGLGPFTDKYAMWGNPALQRSVWAAHDPVSQAARLRGTQLHVSVARHGRRGPLDPKNAQAVDPAEAFCWYTTKPLLARLKDLRIPVTTHLYEEGTHSWVYWQRELHRCWPTLMHVLGG